MANEKVDDDRKVPSEVVVPELLRGLLVGLLIDFDVLHLGLAGHLIHVLVNAIEKVGKELLGVLLAVPVELGREFRDDPLEVPRRN